MKRYLPVLLGLTLLAATTACTPKFLKGSITGTVKIVSGGSEFPASYFVIRLVQPDGTIIATTGSDNSGYFRFMGANAQGEEVSLKVSWGDYILKVYRPNLGGGGEESMVLEEKIVLRKGVGSYKLRVRSEDLS